MKRLGRHVYDAGVWLIAIFVITGLFIYLAWLAYPESFGVLVGLMLAVSLLAAMVPIIVSIRKEDKVHDAFRLFLLEPDEENEALLYQHMPKVQHPYIMQLGRLLREKEDALTSQALHVADYEGYIEEWVHEIKKPLSLLTLILDNRSDEMTPLVQQRVTHARNEILSDVEKILYFSRLRTAHRDYLFESLDLRTVCQEAVQEQQSILEEVSFRIEWLGESQTVYSDEKSLLFILSQLLHNSAKYAAGKESVLQFHIEGGEEIILRIQDNGPGIAAGDLPFIFDKGFTGGKAKATGMGLYLAKRLADDLNIQLQAASNSGLEITLTFPQVK